jgi:murein DD-endopeptidase MepM/ murein hydrolase activator NlpD
MKTARRKTTRALFFVAALASPLLLVLPATAVSNPQLAIGRQLPASDIAAEKADDVAPQPVAAVPAEMTDAARRFVQARAASRKRAQRLTGKRALGFAWPVTRAPVTSPFGVRHFIVVAGETGPHPVLQFHHGADIACVMYQAVHAAKSGVVILAGVNPDYGNVIVIAHPGGWSTLYGHLSRIKVHVGSQIHQHQRIGSCGMTGHATGPHLHFEIRHTGHFFDPMPFLP